MQCPELTDLLSRWMNDIDHQPLEVAFDDQSIILVHVHPDIRVDIATHLSASSEADIESALIQAEPLYPDYCASLTINPADGRFWLVDMVFNNSVEELVQILENSLNQRDTCQQWWADKNRASDTGLTHWDT